MGIVADVKDAVAYCIVQYLPSIDERRKFRFLVAKTASNSLFVWLCTRVVVLTVLPATLSHSIWALMKVNVGMFFFADDIPYSHSVSFYTYPQRLSTCLYWLE